MSKPIAPATGIAFAFPDVCKTPTPGGPVPIPYPNIAQLNQATGVSNTGAPLLVGPSSFSVMLLDAVVQVTTGDEAGSLGGVKSGTIKGPCVVKQASASVVYGSSSKGVARFLDATSHNNDNAQGILLSAFPTVLVGD
jgi:uncharacterized protein DUF4150